MAANNFTGVINSNYGTLGNWSLLVVPTASDGNVATFTNTSPACTVNVSSVANAIDFTNYTNTITFTNKIVVSGNVTLGASMVFAGAAADALSILTASTMTSNGVTVGVPLTLSGNVTYTLADSWTVAALVSSSNTATQTINGNTINLGAGYSNTVGTGTIQGTTLLKFTGTGTWTYSASGGTVKNNVTIACGAGTFSFTGRATGVALYTGTFTYTSGSFGTFSGALSINNTTTLDWGGSTNIMPLAIFTVNATVTITLLSNVYLSGTFTQSGGTYTINGFTIFLSGNLTTTTGIMQGTTVFTLSGGGTWSGNFPVKNSITFAGNYTVSGTVQYNTGTMTYSSGTITTTSSTITVGASTTFATSGMSWNNITVSATSTLTINSTLTVGGTLTLSANTTFAGTAGFSVNTLSATTAGLTHTLVHAVTYTVTTSLVFTGTLASHMVVISDDGTTKALLTLTPGASQSVSFTNATRIDSSGGQTIWDFGGTLTTTVNWNLLVPTSVQSAYTHIN